MFEIPRTIYRNWFGTPAPSVQIRKPGKRWEIGSSRQKRRTVRVSQVIDETPTTKTYVLEPLDGEDLTYVAGQHLTVLTEIDGVAFRRCYSFSSTPGIGAPAITVKHIPDGRVSGFLSERIEAGHTLRVAEPSGVFTLVPDVTRVRRFVMLAGGVGITPLVSMAEAILRGEPKSQITMLYGNRSEGEIIFRRRLASLAAEFPDRFRVIHSLDDAGAGWKGQRGALTGERVLEILGGTDATTEYLVCGPDPMMNSVTQALSSAGVATENVRLERFAYATAGTKEHPQESFTVSFGSSGRTIRTRTNEPILTTALAAGVDLDYSCQMGGCGQCKVKTAGGTVVMDDPNCLTPREVAEGYVLTCCAYAASDVTVEGR